MAQAIAHANPRKQGPHTLGGAVKAIDEGALHPVGWCMFQGGPLKLAVGLGKGHRTFGVAVAQMPDHPATDEGGQIDPIGETLAMLFIGQNIRRQRQVTFDQDADQTVLAQGAAQAIEGHR